MGCNLCTLQKREEHYKLLYEIAQVSGRTWSERRDGGSVGKAEGRMGERQRNRAASRQRDGVRLHAWAPLSIKVSEDSYCSSAEGDVRASLAPFPMLAPGEFLTSPSALERCGSKNSQPMCSTVLLCLSDGLVFPLFASDLMRSYNL